MRRAGVKLLTVGGSGYGVSLDSDFRVWASCVVGTRNSLDGHGVSYAHAGIDEFVIKDI